MYRGDLWVDFLPGEGGRMIVFVETEGGKGKGGHLNASGI